MYYYNGDKRIENPLWYDVKQGVLMINLRKLKVIFNKGEKELEQVFEFVINKITETHENGQLYCEVKGDGLAFQELGKIGYKISLDEETFNSVYDEWWEQEDRKDEEEPIASIDFWCGEIFKNSNWNYRVEMDWSGYDGYIAKNGERAANKIYEEDYVDSWYDTDSGLTPQEMVSFKEKARIVSTEKSNLYNITQTIAETFGVYCRYEYDYDENYHIRGRTCVFYNNFLNEAEGRIDINYPYDSSKIERELDSTDIVTKMFVVPVEDETSPSGLITIADVAAHKSHEDYILNFDYLYAIGTITDEQYNTIPDYERSMFLYNAELAPISTQIAELENDLVEYKAQLTTAVSAQTYDKEQMEQATTLMDLITDGAQVLEKNESTPYRATILQDTDGYYVKITQEGVITPEEDSSYSFCVYYYQKVSDSSIEKNWKEYPYSYKYEYDEYGNLVRLTGITIPEDTYSNVLYLTFTYRPRLQYEKIYNTFATQLSKDEAAEKEAEEKIAQIEEKIEKLQKRYDELLAKKEAVVADFENMMGAALKEGSWQAEEYSDYGTRYDSTFTISTNSYSVSAEGNDTLRFFWDSNLFDEEEKNYELDISEAEGLEDKVYYPAIDISNHLTAIKDNLDDLSVIFDGDKKSATIGSELQFGFFYNSASQKTIPVLLVTKQLTVGELTVLKNTCYIGIITSTASETGVSVETKQLVAHNKLSFLDGKSHTFVYPRIEINSLLLKTSEDEFKLKYAGETLKKFYDYSMLIRDDKYYITLKGEFMLRDGIIEKTIETNYKISNAALSLYLDALEVSKENAFPQTSYKVEVSALNQGFISQAYKMLGRVVCINDADLKLSNVQGYISELELSLDAYWEDGITIKNYKTKFEDLFSSIVASSEQMKTNSYSYGLAANAFTSSGSLKSSVIQSTINNVDLTYAFQSGNLTIDEVNGIWATSDAGVVAMRGGGIFCATQKDSYGNWLWNTGITPSGINASLLKAGQIDTNLIKVYAGDNLRFQLNADGLYAYRQNVAGEAKMDEYVVHNSEGLFLTKKINSKNINLVEISWDGLIIRNEKGKEVFYADDAGNLAISGVITAASGEIGSWLIQENGLYSKDGNAGLVSKGDGTATLYDMIWIKNGDNEFKVNSDGVLYANNIVVKGFVSANSFVGNTSIDELNGMARQIELYALQGISFAFNNWNYDGILTVSPERLYFKILTNALSKEELTESNYEFYYSESGEDETWEPVPEEYINATSAEIRNYLTFPVEQGIMYMGEDSPKTQMWLKVVKRGLQRLVNEETGEVSLGEEEYLYENKIQLIPEFNGFGKFITEMSPQSYTFVEDKNNELAYADSQVFSVELTGFTREEALQGRWLIDGVDTELDMSIVGTSTTNRSTDGESMLISDEDEIVINGEVVEEGDTIIAQDLTTESGFEVYLEEIEDDVFKAYAVVSNSRVPEGGSIQIIFQMNKATRSGFCFKNRNGADSISILINSTSGDTLASGDISTILEAAIYYGTQQMNDKQQLYYVWKRDEVALSSLRRWEESEITNDDTTITTKGEAVDVPTDSSTFFTQSKIYITAADFGLKAIYGCAVFTTLEEAIAEYNLLNENGDQKE